MGRVKVRSLLFRLFDFTTNRIQNIRAVLVECEQGKAFSVLFCYSSFTYRPLPFSPRSLSLREYDVSHLPQRTYVSGTSNDLPYSGWLFSAIFNETADDGRQTLLSRIQKPIAVSTTTSSNVTSLKKLIWLISLIEWLGCLLLNSSACLSLKMNRTQRFTAIVWMAVGDRESPSSINNIWWVHVRTHIGSKSVCHLSYRNIVWPSTTKMNKIPKISYYGAVSSQSRAFSRGRPLRPLTTI